MARSLFESKHQLGTAEGKGLRTITDVKLNEGVKSSRANYCRLQV